MATIAEQILHIQTVLSNGTPSDDFQYSDPQVYFILRTIRQMLLKQKITDGHFISPYNYQTVPCVKLSLQPIRDCDCFTSDCYSLQSTCALPKIMSSRRSLVVEGVYTVNSNKPFRLDYIDLDTYRLAKYSKTMKNLKGWFIGSSNKLHIVGYDRLGAVRVSALFEDPLEVMMMSDSCGCNEDGSSICTDPYNADFPLDGDLSKSLWMMTYEELLKVGMMIPPDLKNDALGSYGTLDKK